MILLHSSVARLVLPFSLILLSSLTAFSQTPAPAAQPATSSTPPAEVPLSAAATRSQAAQKEVGKRFSGGWGKKLKEGGTTAVIQLLVSMFGAIFVFELFFNLRRKKNRSPRLGSTGPATLGCR